MAEALLPPVPRPGLGRLGRRTRMRANFFEMIHLPDANIHHYDIVIADDRNSDKLLPAALNRRVYQAFEEENHGTVLRGILAVYDGARNMYSPKPLPFDAQAFRVALPEAGKRQPQNFNVRIKKVAEVVMEELHRFLNGNGPATDGCLTAITALDILIRHKPSMMFTPVRSSFFTPEGARTLTGGVEAWQGYFQSARPTRGRMLLNLDVATTAFYEGGPLINTVARFLKCRSPNDLRGRYTDRDRVKLERVLKHLRFRVKHRGESFRRQYRIGKLTQTSASQSTFNLADGRQIDVANYFREQYNIRLNFPFLPCVVVGGSRDTYFPIEVCEAIEGKRYEHKLNEDQTRAMLEFTCQPPAIRFDKIMAGYRRLDYRQNEYLQQFGVTISKEVVQVPARVLPTPTVCYHETSRQSRFEPRDGAWNLRDKKVAAGATLGSWSVIVFDPQFSEQMVRNAIRELVVTCIDTGMNIPNGNPPIMHVGQQGDIEGNLKQAWLRAGNAAKAQPQLIVCILPFKTKEFYAEIKRVSDTVIGVATQCLQSASLRPAKKQYCANVCLKINVKLGGMNSFLNPNHVPFVSERPTIIMGADVTHPPPRDTTHPSIAAVCATMDAKASRYATCIRTQQARTEIITDLGVMTKDLLRAFYQTCGRKPDRILFYRDGVSEGERKQVVNDEVVLLKAACDELERGYNPPVTFVVVSKRHHARLMPIDRSDSDKSGNAPAGTVVETDITHPFEFDFYLQSHPGLKGTSRPCHYHVLLDENKFEPDNLQALSYNLCYIYARATRAISQVTPAYYANLICQRARLHARGEHWSESASSSEGTGVAISYAEVKMELQKVMYFM